MDTEQEEFVYEASNSCGTLKVASAARSVVVSSSGVLTINGGAAANDDAAEMATQSRSRRQIGIIMTLEEQIADLYAQNVALENENAELRRQIQKPMFKAKYSPGGGPVPGGYCGHCGGATHTAICENCGWSGITVHGKELRI